MRAQIYFILLLSLTGLILTNSCVDDNNGSRTSNDISTTGVDTFETKPVDTFERKPVSELPKPEIDVIVSVLKKKSSSSVRKNQKFDLILEVKNNNLTSPAAKSIDIEIRGHWSGPTGAMDIPVSSTGFTNLNLAPQEKKQKTINISLHKGGIWTLIATIKPRDFIDTKNNEKTLQVVVDY